MNHTHMVSVYWISVAKSHGGSYTEMSVYLLISPEDFGAESKRHKGIGIGAPEGPISLDDVRSLQRSNTVSFNLF